MPTKKYRMSMTLDDDVRAALNRLSVALDTPGPTFVASLLRDSLPSLLKLARIAEEAKAARVGSLKGVNALLDDYQGAVAALFEERWGYDSDC